MHAWKACVLAVALALVPGAASAAPRSLAAATARLPESTVVLGSSNVKSVRSTATFKELFPELVKQSSDLKDGIATVKKLCGVDPTTAVEDVSMAEDKSADAIVFVALVGMDEAKAVECATKLAKEELGGSPKAEKVASKADGTIYKVSSGKDAVFFAWLPGEVVAIAGDPEDKDVLEKMLSGKGGIKKSKLASRLGKLDANAAVTGIWAKEQTFEGRKVRGGDVNVTVSNGNVSMVGAVEMESAKEAQDLAQLIQTMSSMINKFASGASVDARAVGSEVRIQARVPETELLKALKDALGKI